MKTVTFRNKMTLEKFLCDNTRDRQYIDGVEYITVRRLDSPRTMLMRRDILEKLEEKIFDK